MPTITSLKPQKRGKRVNVYVDEEFAFAIDLDNLVLLGIKTGKEFTSEELNIIVKKSEFQKTFNNLLRFVSIRPRSESEINFWLKRKETPISLIGDLKEKIKKLGFLDDVEFAKWWIEQRQSFKPKSKRVLAMELRQKGISKEVISDLIDKSDIDEEHAAKILLEKKKGKDKDKQFRFLISKGFSWDIAKKLTGEGYKE